MTATCDSVWDLEVNALGYPAPPGDGLAWYLQAAWNKETPSKLPANLPDGELSWQREHDDLRESVRWAKQELSHLLST